MIAHSGNLEDREQLENFALLAHLTVQDNILLPREFLTFVDTHLDAISTDHDLVLFNQLTHVIFKY